MPRRYLKKWRRKRSHSRVFRARRAARYARRRSTSSRRIVRRRRPRYSIFRSPTRQTVFIKVKSYLARNTVPGTYGSSSPLQVNFMQPATPWANQASSYQDTDWARYARLFLKAKVLSASVKYTWMMGTDAVITNGDYNPTPGRIIIAAVDDDNDPFDGIDTWEEIKAQRVKKFKHALLPPNNMTFSGKKSFRLNFSLKKWNKVKDIKDFKAGEATIGRSIPYALSFAGITAGQCRNAYGDLCWNTSDGSLWVTETQANPRIFCEVTHNVMLWDRDETQF